MIRWGSKSKGRSEDKSRAKLMAQGVPDDVLEQIAGGGTNKSGCHPSSVFSAASLISLPSLSGAVSYQSISLG